MPTFSEPISVVIEKPQTEKHVTYLEGRDLDTSKMISIRAKEKPTGDCYLRSNYSDKNLQIIWLKAGSEETPCFFVADPRDLSKNLLLEMERKYTES